MRTILILLPLLLTAAPLGAEEVLRRRAAIVVLTDGEDNGSKVQYADVLLASHEANRPVFAVAVGRAGGQQRSARRAPARGADGSPSTSPPPPG